MNSKRQNFLISYSILTAFTIIIVLVVNYYMVSIFGFNQENFMLITVFLLIIGVALNVMLSKPLLEPLFKSDDNLQKTIKETLHELNIPVSTIQANTQMLEKNLKNEKNIKRLNRIKQASSELLKLYDDMEYEIKKEIGKVELQEFDLSEVIQASVLKFQDIKQNISIKLTLEKSLLRLDKNGFSKVIDNLLSNAIKYNKEDGFVHIKFDGQILSIQNSGKTIDTKNLFDVFDQYFQENSEKNGFGLGLSIVKEFCDKHAIDIKIIPLEDGTIFELNLQKVVNIPILAK